MSALGRWGLRLCLLGLWSWAVAPRELAAEEAPIGVVDLHVDLAYQHLYKGHAFSLGTGQVTPRTSQVGGLRGMVLPLYLPLDASPQGRTRAELQRAYAGVFGALLATPPYSLPGCAIRRAGGTPREIDTYLAFEGAGQFAGHTDELASWALRGVRSFGFVHANSNALATSSGDALRPGEGLTVDGRRFVREVMRVGGLVDVSHASDAATDEVLDMAERDRAVVVATHSNARKLAPHPRNLTDEQIRRIATTGGVVGVNFHQRFLAPDGGWSAGLEDVVRQMDHLRRVGGLGVVAIGSDFEGGIRPVPELSNAGKFQRLARALRAAGWARRDIERAFFVNAERVLCSQRGS